MKGICGFTDEEIVDVLSELYVERAKFLGDEDASVRQLRHDEVERQWRLFSAQVGRRDA